MLADLRAEISRQWAESRADRQRGWQELMADPQQSRRLVTIWLLNAFGFWALWMLAKYLILNRQRPEIPDGGLPGDGEVVSFPRAA